MAITTPLNEKANVKLPTEADSLIAGRKIVSLQELQTSTLNQTTIIIGTFAVDVSQSKALLVIVDGRKLTEGASNDYTLTSVSPNNTSNTISLNQPLAAGLNIELLYLGVVVTNSTSLDTLSPAMSDEVDESNLWSMSPGFGTVTNFKVFSRRVGGKLHVRGSGFITTGTATSGLAFINIPAKYGVDMIKYDTRAINRVGGFESVSSGQKYNDPATDNPVVAYLDGADFTKVYLSFVAASNLFSPVGVTTFTSGNTSFQFEFELAIAGWSANVVAANSKVFNASAFAANGTNVTSTPTQLGQYRTYTKNASALTGTDNAPTGGYLPSNLNGFKIDGSIPFASAGTSGQPNRWEIFIGLNKFPQLALYSSTGRTGAVSLVDPDVAASFYGISMDYDPTTGVVFVDAIDQPAATTTRNAGRSMPTGGAAPTDLPSLYFDIIVSDNALPVQFSDPSKVPEVRHRFSQGAASFGAVNTGAWNWPTIAFSIGSDVTPVVDTNLGSYFLINSPGMYCCTLSVRVNTAAGSWIMKNVPSPASTAPSSSDPNLIAYNFQDAVTWDLPLCNTVFLKKGDRVFSGNDAGGTNNGSALFEINKVSNG